MLWQVIEKENLQKNSKIVGTHLLNELAKLRDEFECVGDVRGKGLMIGIELVENKTTRSPLPAKHFMDIWEDCKEMGVLVGRGGITGNVSYKLHKYILQIIIYSINYIIN